MGRTKPVLNEGDQCPDANLLEFSTGDGKKEVYTTGNVSIYDLLQRNGRPVVLFCGSYT
ncbi:hypothetical protein SAMD00019534_089230 [Acytostelium subglobosum LB1]|uniref:hypothetical protein n=1 Tax=Acytostelium subglobosum LB1 TaxID=1410327 RepID=UPI000644C6E6|nr:hypothetical protein SAMD00019534_089230 [Acytostelium subglobosum LB1]GAM25748.1 hypothetical protein SAMD00019534_089230 [Acytostelium subglobosum LB1]|eukprot:XP_012751266.1 hypothetical protein SAMD00019534_089230 [Acytostelium subglobosum LB1]